MLEYISHIIFPYIKSMWERVGEDSAAIAIIKIFNGQVTDPVLSLLEYASCKADRSEMAGGYGKIHQ